jgi:hypothetical protein
MTDPDRPDLPCFDGLDVIEHAGAAAEAIRAINHITSWRGGGMTYPSDAYAVLTGLAATAAMLPQAVNQIAAVVRAMHAGALIGIDPGTRWEGDPAGAVEHAHAALALACLSAAQLHTALHTAAEALAFAHWTGADPEAAVIALDGGR